MAVESRTQLKTYFETGDYPTQSQFINLIDSSFSLNDDSFVTKIGTASSSVTGLLSSTDWARFDAVSSYSFPPAGIPLSTGSMWDTSIVNNSANWNTAYSWGNHASAGYYVGSSSTIRGLLSSTATGLTYTSSTGVLSLTSGYVIPTTTEESNWNAAYGWGNHASAGYLTSSSLLTSGSASVGAIQYNGTTQAAGQFDGGTTNPSHTIRLNYDGKIYVTEIESNSVSNIGIYGKSTNNSGVVGDSINNIGVTGSSSASNGVYGYSIYGYGIYARSLSNSSACITQLGDNNNTEPLLLITKLSNGTGAATSNIISITDNPTTSGTISGKVLSVTIGTTERISLNPRVVSTGSAVAHMFDTHNALASGDRLFVINNNGNNKAYFNYDGSLLCNGTITATNNFNVGTTYLYSSGRVSMAGNSDLHQAVPDSASALAFKLNTTNTLSTSGSKLLSIQNNTVERFRVTPTTTDIGDIAGGNYTSIESDGTIVFNGNATVFRDEISDAISLQQTGAGISRNATESTVDYITTANTADYMYCNVQLNHDRKSNSVIHPHIHWFQAQANTPNWLLQYRIQLLNGAKTTAWTDYKCNTNAFTYTSGTLHQISYGAGITVNGSVSDIVQFRIIRDTTNVSTLFGADPYTATVAVLSFDNHIQCDSVGSRTEYTK